MKEQKVEFVVKGVRNLGSDRTEKVEKFSIEAKESCIHIKDNKGKVIVSFNPFFDGGSLWITDFSSLIMDIEEWGEDEKGKFKCLRTDNITTSSLGVKKWKEDSGKLRKIREAQDLLKEEE